MAEVLARQPVTASPEPAPAPPRQRDNRPPAPPIDSRWRCFQLEATPASTARGFVPKKLVIFERIDKDLAEEDREFRVWSEKFCDDERWTFSEGFIEDRVLRLDGRGYEVEKPRASRVGARWGYTFVLKAVFSDLDVAKVIELESEMYRMERASDY